MTSTTFYPTDAKVVIIQNNFTCIKPSCGQSVLGDPKYHEVYREGIKVGYRHRRCII